MVSKVTIFLFLAIFMLAYVPSQAKQCPEACIEIYKPVCARCHGKLEAFGNICLLNLHNCKKNDCVFVKKGDCGV